MLRRACLSAGVVRLKQLAATLGIGPLDTAEEGVPQVHPSHLFVLHRARTYAVGNIFSISVTSKVQVALGAKSD